MTKPAATEPGTSEPGTSERTTLRYGERILLMLFGLALLGVGFGDNVITTAVNLFGGLVFLAALGVVELAMAIWYGLRRSAP